jgi:hypothetical protein
MKKALLVIHDLVLAILVELISLPLSLFVPFVCLFIKWDENRSTWSGGVDHPEYPTWRGDLPKWAYIWGTPDERMPGDVGMQRTREVLDWTTGVFGQKIGRYLTSVWWLWRNRMYGLSWVTSARPSDGEFVKPQTPGLVWYEKEGIWRWWRRFGPVELQAGWKPHRADEKAHWQRGPFVVIRYVSIRRARTN